MCILSIYTREMNIYVCTLMLRTAFFKQPKAEQSFNRMIMYAAEYYSAIKRYKLIHTTRITLKGMIPRKKKSQKLCNM